MNYVEYLDSPVEAKLVDVAEKLSLVTIHPNHQNTPQNTPQHTDQSTQSTVPQSGNKYRPPPKPSQSSPVLAKSPASHKKLIEDEDELDPPKQNKYKAPPPKVPPKPTLPSRSNSVPVTKMTLDSLPVPIPVDALRRYSKLFTTLDSKEKTGLIDASTTKDVWHKSKLSANELAKVWHLSDGATDDGKLGLGEWCLGLHLIDERLRGYSVPSNVVDLVHSLWNGKEFEAVLHDVGGQEAGMIIGKLLADTESCLDQ